MNSLSITRNAVGRVARLGDLYDARTDTFVGFSILNTPIHDDAIEIIKSSAYVINYINTGRNSEKFEKLNILPELRASILANLVSLEGHGKYLENGRNCHKTRKSLLYSIQTEVENFIFGQNIEELFNLDVLDLVFATHFVVGIIWGANTIITLEGEGDNENTDDDLKEELRKLGSSIYEKNDVTPVRDDKKYSVQIHGDILPATNLPKNVQDARVFLKKVPRLVNLTNQGKGKPISYTLMPISVLCDLLIDVPSLNQDIVMPLNEEAIVDFIKFVDQFNEVKQEINNVIFLFESHNYCIPGENVHELTQLKSEVEKKETKLRNKFKDSVVAIRSGNLAAKDLQKIYAEWNIDSMIGEITTRLLHYENWRMKITLIEKLTSRGVIHIGSDKSIGLSEIKKKSVEVFIMFLRTGIKRKSPTLWTENRNYYFKLVNSCHHSDPAQRSFVVVDLDMRPDLAINKTEKEIRIVLSRNGNFVDFDMYATSLEKQQICYAKSYEPYEKSAKPSNRIELKLICPGSIKGTCNNSIHKWICAKCEDPLAWGFDNYFYCLCGRVRSKYFYFRCSDKHHGDQFFRFQPNYLEKLLNKIPPLQELNILIMGVTGVGKSTWINSFLNYLAFPSLEEAAKNELLSVTSTKFQMTDDDDIMHTIQIGHDENEVLAAGQSATQDVKAHLFPVDNTLLRLIDTPGIGDVRGVEQDKENFSKILRYLSTLKYLNGICILLKPNESRLNVLFEFCIKELLTHLHRSAAKNVVFCFTHSRETFYKPGDTRAPLWELIWQSRIDMTLDKDTMYCMDNESFRFLCAANQQVQFRDSVKKSFSESWNISVEETNRLISHFKKLECHNITDTISLNDTRKNIVCLTKPIADISKNIQMNLTLIKDKQELIKTSKATEAELVKMLYLDYIKLKSYPLNHPRTVCGSSSCVKYHPAADGSKDSVEYVSHCHSHCYLIGVPVSIIGDMRLQQCQAMNGTLNCIECGCCWDQHLHITYIQKPVTVRKTVPEVNNKISGKKNERQQIEDFIRDLEEFGIEQENEQRKIIEVSVKLGRFLSKNAILPYNDVMGRYIDYLIEKEEQLFHIGGDNKVLKRLKIMREMYEEELTTLKMAMAESDVEELNAEDVKLLLNELYALKHNGAQLQNAIEQASTSGRDKNVKKNYETFHGPKNQANKKWEFQTRNRFDSLFRERYSEKMKNGNEGYIKKVIKAWNKSFS